MEVVRRTLAPLCLFFVSACAAELGDPAPYSDPTVCPLDIQEQLLVRRCALDGCHVSAGAPGGLVFAAADLPLFMLDRPASTCREQLLIDSANPDASHILTRLSPDPMCGEMPIDRMPLVGNKLDENELACVRAWVSNVASGGALAP